MGHFIYAITLRTSDKRVKTSAVRIAVNFYPEVNLTIRTHKYKYRDIHNTEIHNQYRKILSLQSFITKTQVIVDFQRQDQVVVDFFLRWQADRPVRQEINPRRQIVFRINVQWRRKSVTQSVTFEESWQLTQATQRRNRLLTSNQGELVANAPIGQTVCKCLIAPEI